MAIARAALRENPGGGRSGEDGATSSGIGAPPNGGCSAGPPASAPASGPYPLAPAAGAAPDAAAAATTTTPRRTAALRVRLLTGVGILT